MKQEKKVLAAPKNIGDSPRRRGGPIREFISQDDTDDEVFLQAVARIFNGLTTQRRPAELHLIRVRNWFDHKWLRYSGKGRVNFEAGGWGPGVALDAFFSDQTFPPFTPNRILDERIFTRADGGCEPAWAVVHSSFRERSCWNLHTRVADHTDSGLFVWYSSNSKPNRRGALMAITVKDGVVERWYASFLGEKEWKLGRVKGCDSEEVESHLEDWPEEE